MSKYLNPTAHPDLFAKVRLLGGGDLTIQILFRGCPASYRVFYRTTYQKKTFLVPSETLNTEKDAPKILKTVGAANFNSRRLALAAVLDRILKPLLKELAKAGPTTGADVALLKRFPQAQTRVWDGDRWSEQRSSAREIEQALRVQATTLDEERAIGYKTTVVLCPSEKRGKS